MNEREYFRLRREAKAECQKKLDALDLVWQLANGTPPPEAKRTRTPRVVGSTQGTMEDLIGGLLPDLPESFIAQDVMSLVVENGMHADRSTVSHTLMRMHRAGVIRLIAKGGGKRSAKYGKLAAVDRLASQLNRLASDAATATINPSTPEQHEAIRSIAKERQLDVDSVRREILIGKYGVTKLIELTFEQAEELQSVLSQLTATG